MVVKLGWTAGTIYDSKRAAALLAIKVKDNVLYEFQSTEYIMTPAEARELLPELIAKVLEDLDSFKKSFNKRLDYLQKDLSEVTEAALQP